MVRAFGFLTHRTFSCEPEKRNHFHCAKVTSTRGGASAQRQSFAQARQGLRLGLCLAYAVASVSRLCCRTVAHATPKRTQVKALGRTAHVRTIPPGVSVILPTYLHELHIAVRPARCVNAMRWRVRYAIGRGRGVGYAATPGQGQGENYDFHDTHLLTMRWRYASSFCRLRRSISTRRGPGMSRQGRGDPRLV